MSYATNSLCWNNPVESIDVDLSEYIDVFNFIISLESETKIFVDDFYNRFGLKGFEIFNYDTSKLKIFYYNDPNNDVWYHIYNVFLNKCSRGIFLCYLLHEDLDECPCIDL